MHSKCRQKYTKPQEIVKSQCPTHADDGSSRSRRSLMSFTFKENCLFCGHEIVKDKKRTMANETSTACTLQIKDSLLRICDSRGDEWADSVRARLEAANDLPAEESIYHRNCSSNFRTGRNIPVSHTGTKSKMSKGGRPKVDTRENAFIQVIQYLQENDDEQITIGDLMAKMNEYMVDDANASTFTDRYMKQRLLDNFGDQIVITEIDSKANVVTFRKRASRILQEFYVKQTTDPSGEKTSILNAAAALLRDDIKDLDTS